MIKVNVRVQFALDVRVKVSAAVRTKITVKVRIRLKLRPGSKSGQSKTQYLRQESQSRFVCHV